MGAPLQFGPGGSAGGDRYGVVVSDFGWQASIRPRRLGRGGPGRRRGRAARLHRFNSAPAARPGGTPVHRLAGNVSEMLQFGPGGSAGGDQVRFKPERRPVRLQFGPGGSAGGDTRQRVNDAIEKLLQFGPGGSAGGDEESDDHMATERLASIRPRRLGRGGPLALQVQEFPHFEPRSARDTGHNKPMALSMLMCATVTDGPDTFSASRAAWMPCKNCSLGCQRTCDQKP